MCRVRVRVPCACARVCSSSSSSSGGAAIVLVHGGDPLLEKVVALCPSRRRIAPRDAQLGGQHTLPVAHLRGYGKRVRPGLVRACHAQWAQPKKVKTSGLVLGAVAASGWAVAIEVNQRLQVKKGTGSAEGGDDTRAAPDSRPEEPQQRAGGTSSLYIGARLRPTTSDGTNRLARTSRGIPRSLFCE